MGKNSLGDVSGNLEMPKFGLNIPGFPECRSISSNVSNGISQLSQERDKTPNISTMQWPGIEAVIDSYKKYSQDVTDQLGQLRDLKNKLQLDISTKRSFIDNLSSQMASLSRY